ncbi:MAG: class I SAM-dependent methyltransferase [Malacoplasma sp.]|nr:class I SAM-dependent methyltransferase [Malacoplasma sp.]
MRIREIANLINNTKIVVDVGSDHAQLSIFLISENRANLVYNIEKNDKPFLNSVNNTKKYKDKIINLKSDGFEKFDKSIEIDYCTISGMGSKTMIEILCKCINKIKNIIVCPNNNEYLIRKFAYDNFYKIKKDFFIRENEIFYPIIWLSKSEGIKQKNFKKNLLCGEKKVKKNDLLYPLYLENKISSLEKIENLKKNNKEKYIELKIYKKELKKWK